MRRFRGVCSTSIRRHRVRFLRVLSICSHSPGQLRQWGHGGAAEYAQLGTWDRRAHALEGRKRASTRVREPWKPSNRPLRGPGRPFSCFGGRILAPVGRLLTAVPRGTSARFVRPLRRTAVGLAGSRPHKRPQPLSQTGHVQAGDARRARDISLDERRTPAATSCQTAGEAAPFAVTCPITETNSRQRRRSTWNITTIDPRS